VRWLAGAAEDLANRWGQPAPIQRVTVDKYTEDVAIDGQRIQTRARVLPPAFDLAAGWQDALRTMRVNT